MSQSDPLDPELIFSVRRPLPDLTCAIDDLYLSYYKEVQLFERDMDAIHKNYLNLIAPAAAEICRRSAQGRILIGEDFLQNVHARSAHIAEEARRIRISFEKQHRAALDLAKMI